MGFITKPVGGLVGDLAGGIAEGSGANNSFNANPAELQQSNYQDLINQGQGQALNNQAASATAAQQSALADALRAQAAGGGPANELAQAQLRDATARNAAMAAGQAASQKGLNPALAARLAGQNQANAQQQAANQSAILRGQGSLQAQSQLGNALSAQRQADIGQQRTNLEALQTAGSLQNQQNQGQIQNQLGSQGINAGIAGENARTRAAIAGGLMQGAGAAAGAMAHGGLVKGYADGGNVSGYNFQNEGMMMPRYNSIFADQPLQANNGPSLGVNTNFDSNAGQLLDNVNDAANPGPNFAAALGGLGQGVGKGLASAGGFKSMAPSFANFGPAMAHGGQATNMTSGGHVKGDALVPGDSPQNDIVPAVLSPGEIVLPRSITLAPDAEQKAADFVSAIKGKEVEHKAEGGPVGFAKVLAKHRELEGRMAKLEKHLGKKVK